MTKQLERLNIKPPYSTRPLPSSGHRHISLSRATERSYTVLMYKNKYGSKTLPLLKHALCYKFILILKNKANIIHRSRH